MVAGVAIWLVSFRPFDRPGDSPSIRVAVLPFACLNTAPENERLADAVTAEITNGLARSRHLRVIARSSAFQYKGRNLDVREIAGSLNVEAVVEGIIRSRDDGIQISVHLVDADNGFQRWSRTYEPSAAEKPAIYSDIVRDISRALRVPPPGDSESFWTRAAKPEAYELVLKARYLGPTTPDAGAAKISYYRAAIERDSRYVSAWLGMADTWARLAGAAAVPPRDAMEKAREAVAEALRLDDSNADAHFLAASIYWSYEWNWPAADREFRHAIQLDPNSATIRLFYAQYLSQMGRFDEALREVESIRVLEPLTADSRTMEANVDYLNRQYDRCLRLCQSTLAAHPAAWGLHYWLGRSYASKGMVEESVAALERFHPGKDVGGRGFGMLGATYALSGRRADALNLLARVMDRAKRSYVSSVSVAQIHIGLGNVDSAFEWLERGYRERDLTMPTLKTEPAFYPVRADPRFVSLVRRLNLDSDSASVR